MSTIVRVASPLFFSALFVVLGIACGRTDLMLVQEQEPSDASFPDGTLARLPDGSMLLPDGAVRLPDGGILQRDAAVLLPDGAVLLTDGAVQLADGAVTRPDGAVLLPDGGMAPPSSTGTDASRPRDAGQADGMTTCA